MIRMDHVTATILAAELPLSTQLHASTKNSLPQFFHHAESSLLAEEEAAAVVVVAAAAAVTLR